MIEEGLQPSAIQREIAVDFSLAFHARESIAEGLQPSAISRYKEGAASPPRSTAIDETLDVAIDATLNAAIIDDRRERRNIESTKHITRRSWIKRIAAIDEPLNRRNI